MKIGWRKFSFEYIGTIQSSLFGDKEDNSYLLSNNFCNITGILRLRSNGTILSVFRIRLYRRFLIDEKRRFNSVLVKSFGWWKSWENEESDVIFDRGGVEYPKSIDWWSIC